MKIKYINNEIVITPTLFCCSNYSFRWRVNAYLFPQSSLRLLQSIFQTRTRNSCIRSMHASYAASVYACTMRTSSVPQSLSSTITIQTNNWTFINHFPLSHQRQHMSALLPCRDQVFAAMVLEQDLGHVYACVYIILSKLMTRYAQSQSNVQLCIHVYWAVENNADATVCVIIRSIDSVPPLMQFTSPPASIAEIIIWFRSNRHHRKNESSRSVLYSKDYTNMHQMYICICATSQQIDTYHTCMVVYVHRYHYKLI